MFFLATLRWVTHNSANAMFYVSKVWSGWKDTKRQLPWVLRIVQNSTPKATQATRFYERFHIHYGNERTQASIYKCNIKLFTKSPSNVLQKDVILKMNRVLRSLNASWLTFHWNVVSSLQSQNAHQNMIDSNEVCQ